MTSLDTPRNLAKINSVVDNLGYPFIRWLLNEIESTKVEKIFFVSRDGYWFHEIFSEMKHSHALPIKADYLLLSRASLNELAEKIRNCHSELNDLTYLNESFKGLSTVGIVDLGWTASSLGILREIFPQIDFRGFFFATHKTKSSGIKSFMGRVRILKYLGLSEILESLFSAPHPSVKRVVGSSKKPSITFFESDEKLLSIHESLRKFRLQNQSVNTRYWSRMKVKANLLLLCVFPDKIIFEAFSKVSHGSKGEDFLKVELGQYAFFGTKNRALVPFWSIRSIFMQKVSATRKFSLLVLFLTSQVEFVLSRLKFPRC